MSKFYGRPILVIGFAAVLIAKTIASGPFVLTNTIDKLIDAIDENGVPFEKWPTSRVVEAIVGFVAAVGKELDKKGVPAPKPRMLKLDGTIKTEVGQTVETESARPRIVAVLGKAAKGVYGYASLFLFWLNGYNVVGIATRGSTEPEKLSLDADRAVRESKQISCDDKGHLEQVKKFLKKNKYNLQKFPWESDDGYLERMFRPLDITQWLEKKRTRTNTGQITDEICREIKELMYRLPGVRFIVETQRSIANLENTLSEKEFPNVVAVLDAIAPGFPNIAPKGEFGLAILREYRSRKNPKTKLPLIVGVGNVSYEDIFTKPLDDPDREQEKIVVPDVVVAFYGFRNRVPFQVRTTEVAYYLIVPERIEAIFQKVQTEGKKDILETAVEFKYRDVVKVQVSFVKDRAPIVDTDFKNLLQLSNHFRSMEVVKTELLRVPV